MQHNHPNHEHTGHQGIHHHDIAQANRHHFDKTAKDFDAMPFITSRGEGSVANQGITGILLKEISKA